MASKQINIRFNEAYAYSGGGNDILFEYSLDNTTFQSGYYSFPEPEPLSGDYSFNVGSEYVPEVWVRVSVKNNLGEVILSETFHYSPGTSCGLTSITQSGASITLAGFVIMAYKTGDPNQLVLQQADTEIGNFADFYTINNAMTQSPSTGSSSIIFNTVLNSGKYYRLKVLDVDGNPVYSNPVLFAGETQTSVKLNSISSNTPNLIDADYVNAYGNSIGQNDAYIYQSNDGVSGWVVVASVNMQSSPFTGNMVNSFGATNNRYYKIGVKNSSGNEVFSNVRQYVAKTLSILQAISSCNGNQQSESVQVKVNYDSTAHTYQLQYWDGSQWMVIASTPGNGSTQFYISVSNTGFQPLYYQIRIHDATNGITSEPYSLQMANCMTSVTINSLVPSAMEVPGAYDLNISYNNAYQIGILTVYLLEGDGFSPNVFLMTFGINNNPENNTYGYYNIPLTSGKFYQIEVRDSNNAPVFSNVIQAP